MKLIILVTFFIASAVDTINWEDSNPIDLKNSYIAQMQQSQQKPVRKGRIVNGDMVEDKQFPHAAALFIVFNGTIVSFCGGSLISEKYCLTAAHCCDFKGISVIVVFGARNIGVKETSQQIFFVPETGVKCHENWNRTNLSNDIALLKLPNSPVLNDFVQIIQLACRAHASNLFVNFTATVSGWGKTSDNSTGITNNMRSVNSTVISNDQCKQNYSIIQDCHMCLDGSQMKSSCQGDSGGALLTNYDLERIQIGIVSFGSSLGCAIGYPSVYTRITEYCKWILKNTDLGTFEEQK